MRDHSIKPANDRARDAEYLAEFQDAAHMLTRVHERHMQAAQKLCRIYYKIAEEAIGAAAVEEKRDAMIRGTDHE